jgi:hypothetical protein
VGDAPVMGSDWMAQRGFTAQPKNALAGLAGETVGNILPIAAAAKAPQIANALIRGQDAAGRGAVALGQKGADMAGNYMARQGMIQPATVWHGSPHKFDAFDASKIGTGEGAQAYGHGLYLAESPAVAGEYQRALSSKRPIVDGAVSEAGSLNTQLADDVALNGRQAVIDGKKKLVAFFESKGVKEASWGDGFSLRKAKNDLAQVEAMGNVERNAGQLYKVDLPDEHIAKMLDWDKPLSQQAPEVQKMVKRAGIGGGVKDPSGAELWKYLIEDRLQNTGQSPSVAASQFFAGRGIPGIRYLDGGSRGAGAGTSNYVVFPGEENMLRILERNGVPIGK